MKTLTRLPGTPQAIPGSKRLVVLAALLGALLVWGAGIGGAAPLGQVTKFTAGLSGSTVMGSAGPDGNIWFLETHKVGKITPAGVITEYSTGLNAGNSLFRMGSEGPDGNMWFSDRGTTKAIGRITPDGTITEFSTGLNPSSNPGRLQSGPDGNMWFVDQGVTKAIGVITPTGQITEFALSPTSNPNSVRTGPDGNVWFTDQGTPKAIGMINPTTHAVQEFSAGLNPGSVPQIIETGSDGAMWFSDNGTPSAVGRIDPTTHVIQEFSAGMTSGAAPNGITLGADGNIWVVETGTGGIGSITPAGTITEYPVGVASAIASGADGNLWFGTTGAVGQFGIGAPAASVAAPAVTGSDGVGVPQKCAADTWSTWAGQQPSHDSYIADGYDWLLDGQPIVGADTQSYTPTPADAGHQLSCTATVTYVFLEVTVSATSSFVQVKGAAEQLADLRTAVTGVGPGSSLAEKVRQIQSYVGAADLADACAQLGAFSNEVNAQAGKKLSPAQAASLITQTQHIEAALPC
jgi:streptogramin lyase